MGSERHEELMGRCLDLALNGIGSVAPNPMVGAVIVHNNRIIGEGYHARYGEAHAEVNAINSVKDKSLLKESTLYVSLEPCTHFGKTPPCADRIVEEGIPRVVVAMPDPNPVVNGRGVEMLRQHGVEVTVGVLEERARELNRQYIVHQTKQRPYVVLKWAQTLDGFIDRIRDGADQPAEWITNEQARMMVHKWRSEHQAIMVGTNTVEADNPQLNVRYWHGKNPTRVVIDRRLRLSAKAHVFDGSQPTLLFTGNNSNALTRRNEFAGIEKLEVISLDFAKEVEGQILKELSSRQISSILVEGGGAFLSSFVKKNLWDEARIFVGNKFFGTGIKAPAAEGTLHSFDQIGNSKLFVYRR
ncbi:MAG: bifunctional diaminohydroxyphosphoribosylaminopyrimidine deaminase/5-amino-6-(5-phosphoribosylamino)uracil reductase RibD [Bacteroidales bacterium]|nr:bifunctional diaminohydroxyphosphoribosylaminopyrimidine deaminase/5-amino-6-(5-phosphoribosylamino)uracil reductase RibD [Bacteroidales bacterium]